MLSDWVVTPVLVMKQASKRHKLKHI